MSYMQCPTCGGHNGMVGTQVFSCGCLPHVQQMTNDLQEVLIARSVAPSGDIQPGLPYNNSFQDVARQLIKRGWRKP